MSAIAWQIEMGPSLRWGDGIDHTNSILAIS